MAIIKIQVTVNTVENVGKRKSKILLGGMETNNSHYGYQNEES